MGRLESGQRYPAGIRLDLMFWVGGLKVCLTKDLRYDSKDSREMEKGSFSLSMLRWLEDMVDEGDFCQKLFFSGGEGCSNDQLHCANTKTRGYWPLLTGR